MTVPRSRTKTFSHTISGLLAKRADLLGEAADARKRLAGIRADVAALDRALGALGYAGDLSAHQPRRKRVALFGRGELARALLVVLREAESPSTGREITLAVLRHLGRATDDDAEVADRARRVLRVLRTLEGEGVVASGLDGHGRRLWSLVRGIAG